MSKAAVFTMKLEPDLRAEFMAAAEESHRPASQVVRELMREFVQRQRNRRDHSTFLHGKVAAARASVDEGRGRPDEAVEAAFAARRARITDGA
ncbi:MAG TPA: antitoxin of toxin-antitoxin stability system [Sphingomonas sp.]|jgi:predicted transcriptional regulator|nr:antitoxin of toxin-antitoxin stability system [Sphingomonas sp.]